MKNKIIINIWILLTILLTTSCKKKDNYITNSENLYDIAINYIIDHDNNPNKNKEKYKIFTDFKEFGITKDESYRYVYIWIVKESYYVVENKIVSGSASSMPYKFTFELNENKVVKYEIPKDGNEYISSIKEMYPDDIENKAINYQWNDNKLIKEVRKYYSELKDKNIYYDSGKGYTKLDK